MIIKSISEKQNELQSKVDELSEALERYKKTGVELEQEKVASLMRFVKTMELQYAFDAKKSDQSIKALRTRINELETELVVAANELEKFIEEHDLHGCERSYFYGIKDIDIREKLDRNGYIIGFKF